MKTIDRQLGGTTPLDLVINLDQTENVNLVENTVTNSNSKLEEEEEEEFDEFEEEFEENLVPDGCTYELKYYEGCPAHSS